MMDGKRDTFEDVIKYIAILFRILIRVISEV